MFAVHIFAIIFSLCVVFFADKEGFAWVIGKKTTLSVRRVVILHWLTWMGLVCIIGSGIFLAPPQLGFLIQQPLFVIKMLFVAILLANAILIGRFSKIATEREFTSLGSDEIMPLFTSGAVSMVAWIGTVIVALIVFG